MRRLYLFVSVLSVFLFLVSMKREPVKLLLSGSGWNKIVMIDKQSKNIEWEHKLEKGWECNSVDCTDDGNILFSYKKGAKLITKDHKEIWNIPAPEGCEMQSARVLPDGNILLAWAGTPAVILEVDQTGKEENRVEYNTGIARSHGQFRQINKAKNGNYLLPIMPHEAVYEISPKGELVNKYAVKGNPFTILNDKGNVYWIAGGDKHILSKKDLKKDKVLVEYHAKDIEGTQLFFVAGLAKSERNGLYVCNWQGHDKNAILTNSPQVFELDKRGKIIWSLNDNKKFGKISAISVVK